MGIELAAALHKLYPNDFKMERMAELLVNQAAFEAIEAGRMRSGLPGLGGGRLEGFVRLREKYLLYK